MFAECKFLGKNVIKMGILYNKRGKKELFLLMNRRIFVVLALLTAVMLEVRAQWDVHGGGVFDAEGGV